MEHTDEFLTNLWKQDGNDSFMELLNPEEAEAKKLVVNHLAELITKTRCPDPNENTSTLYKILEKKLSKKINNFEEDPFLVSVGTKKLAKWVESVLKEAYYLKQGKIVPRHKNVDKQLATFAESSAQVEYEPSEIVENRLTIEYNVPEIVEKTLSNEKNYENSQFTLPDDTQISQKLLPPLPPMVKHRLGNVNQVKTSRNGELSSSEKDLQSSAPQLPQQSPVQPYIPRNDLDISSTIRYKVKRLPQAELSLIRQSSTRINPNNFNEPSSSTSTRDLHHVVANEERQRAAIDELKQSSIIKNYTTNSNQNLLQQSEKLLKKSPIVPSTSNQQKSLESSPIKLLASNQHQSSKIEFSELPSIPQTVQAKQECTNGLKLTSKNVSSTKLANNWSGWMLDLSKKAKNLVKWDQKPIEQPVEFEPIESVSYDKNIQEKWNELVMKKNDNNIDGSIILDEINKSVPENSNSIETSQSSNRGFFSYFQNDPKK